MLKVVGLPIVQFLKHSLDLKKLSFHYFQGITVTLTPQFIKISLFKKIICRKSYIIQSLAVT